MLGLRELSAYPPFLQFQVLNAETLGDTPTERCLIDPIAPILERTFSQNYRATCPSLGQVQGSFSIEVPDALPPSVFDSDPPVQGGPRLVLDSPITVQARFDGRWSGLPPGDVDAALIVGSELAENSDLSGPLFKCQAESGNAVSGGGANFSLKFDCQVERLNMGDGKIVFSTQLVIPISFLAFWEEDRADNPSNAQMALVALAQFEGGKLGIIQIEPDPDVPLSRADPLQIDATVQQALRTKSQADLALRIFDQDGVLVASSEFRRIQRDDGPSSERMTIKAFEIPEESTKLVLKAVFIDIVENLVFAESNEKEYVFEKDKVSIVLPTSPDHDAAPVKIDEEISAKLSWTLESKDRAELTLRLTDEDDKLIAASDPVPILREDSPNETPQALTIMNPCPSLDVENMKLSAVMTAPNVKGALARTEEQVVYEVDPPELELVDIEVVQNVQVKNKPPGQLGVWLVEDKPAIVRVYPKLVEETEWACPLG